MVSIEDDKDLKDLREEYRYEKRYLHETQMTIHDAKELGIDPHPLPDLWHIHNERRIYLQKRIGHIMHKYGHNETKQ